MIANILFYIVSAILLTSAVMVVSSRNPVHSVLFLILAFINAAVLFLMAGAEFLAMVLVIVYVGAVAVLFMFVVMMLDVDFVALREGVQRYAPIGAAVGLVLFAELAFVAVSWTISPGANLLRLSPTPTDVTNTVALGSLLYTKYIFLFQMAGAILLVSMIGAIVLTLRDRNRGKRQNVDLQHARMPADTMRMVNAKLGEGAKMPAPTEEVL
ncbi:MAG TPA: NADH-quinone oxidoreductase subunit J [Acidocella sp.]|jgi:NADH-quinone oxidoreductase subunit J|nr:NADH-quinone oxidoreductase subunit J [Acidocella sp.]OYV48966.1 MAG: NADH:ubiquinone oxidoreductase subunit J [Acidocella sp. 20-58-15]OYY05157.1 MAG: NADH:ubiquinone oxidoreductase subunit J [Acidocella sp. 35-58-6]HQT39103.1 NADH-quinone oxidoreductase subunit J [Acidocella sp.]